VIDVLRLHGLSGSVAAQVWFVARDMVRRTRRRGIEHAFTLDLSDATPVGSMLTGSESQTDISPHLRALRLGGAYVQVHTHPRSTSFSPSDLLTCADHAPIHTMVAVGLDGAWHVLSRLPGADFGEPRQLFDDFISAIRNLQAEGVVAAEIPHRAMESISARNGMRYDRVTGQTDEPDTS
jgi:hypothetical protein